MKMRKTLRRADLPAISPTDRQRLHAAMQSDDREAFNSEWNVLARTGQLAPEGGWSSWMLMAGRGYGKTRAGAEWVRSLVENDGLVRVALVASSLIEARSIMVEGPTGLLAVASAKHRPTFEPSRRLLRWPSGAEGYLYSAGEPDSLRGPQHSHAWCDELAKWDQAGGRANAAWDNLQLGLRLGSDPRITVTTTPRAVPLIRRLVADDTVRITRGRTEENAPNLSPAFIAAMRGQFGASVLGRQELDGELLEDIDGALWSRGLLDRCREPAGAGDPADAVVRIVVGVDPPASARGDACGIVVAGLTASGIGVVLADCSVTRPSPERWARAVAEAARVWGADKVIAEANQGGDMVASVLRAANVVLPVKLVRASRGKVARAEPVAALYEAGRVRHAGTFAELEDELCGLMTGGSYLGPKDHGSTSPDRADALVWALSELLLRPQTLPRVLQI